MVGDPQESARLWGVRQVKVAASDVDRQVYDLVLLNRHRVERPGRRRHFALFDYCPERVQLGHHLFGVEALFFGLRQTEDAEPTVVDQPPQLFLLSW